MFQRPISTMEGPWKYSTSSLGMVMLLMFSLLSNYVKEQNKHPVQQKVVESF